MEIFKSLMALLVCEIDVVLTVEGNDKPPNLFGNSDWIYQLGVFVSAVATIMIGRILFRFTYMLSVRIHASRYTATIGDNVTLECTLDAAPLVNSLSWKHITPDGKTKELKADNKYYPTNYIPLFLDGDLVIKDLKIDDEGTYMCTVSNLFTSGSDSTFLTVNEGHLIVTIRQTSSCTEGDNVVLKYSVKTRSPYGIRWKKGGRKITIDDVKYIGGDHLLVITDVKKEQDEGKYICLAETTWGKGSDSVVLTIKRKEEKPRTYFCRQNESIPTKTIQEQIYFIHSVMVNKLSDCIFPEDEIKWAKFLQFMETYVPKRQLTKTFHGIISYLIDHVHISVGHYDKLYEVVYEIDKQASHIIKEAESGIKDIREGGVPHEEPVQLACHCKCKNETQMKIYTRQIEDEFPEIRSRLEGRREQESITFTISPANKPHEPLALYLAQTLKNRLEHEAIEIKEDSVGTLMQMTSPRLNIPTQDKPIVRLSTGHYRYAERETATLKCVVISRLELEYIKWFRLQDGNIQEIAINNDKYIGGPKSPSLSISDANIADTGIYFCRARNAAGETESSTAFVDILSFDFCLFRPRLCLVKDIEWFDLQRMDDGFYINTMQEGIVGQQTGLRADDRIVEVNGLNIEHNSQHEVIRKLECGGNIEMLVVDSKTDEYYKSQGVKVHSDMEEVLDLRFCHPDVACKPTPSKSLGKSVSGFTRFFSRLWFTFNHSFFSHIGVYFREYKNGAGWCVKAVDGDSPAEKVGLRAGDRIVAMNGRDINYFCQRELGRKMEPGDWYFKSQGILYNRNMNGIVQQELSYFCLFRPRLCLVKDIEWFDLQRMDDGFYIKTMQEGIVGQQTGLLAGDRIVELNGLNIEYDSQHEVIQKLECGGNIEMLVVDPKTDEYYKSQGVKVHTDMEEVLDLRFCHLDIMRPRLCHTRGIEEFDLDSRRVDDGFYIKIVNESTFGKTGLQNGDRIVEVNGLNIEYDSQHEVIRKLKCGGNIEMLVVDPKTDEYYKSQGVKVHRDMEEVLDLRFCHCRLNYLSWPSSYGCGFDLDVDKNKGHYIRTVDNASHAKKAGLMAGDKIIEVNSLNIESDSHEEVIRKIKSGDKIALLVIGPITNKYNRPLLNT